MNLHDNTSPEYQERCMVLRHLLRRPSMMKAAEEMINKSHLFSEYPDLSLVWDIGWRYHRDYRKSVPLRVLEHDIDIRREEEGLTVSELERILHAVKDWYADQDFFDEHIQEMLIRYFQDYAAYNLREDLEQKDVEELGPQIEQTSRVFLQNPFTKPVIKQPFSDLESMLVLGDKMPLGVPFLDQALDGGLRSAESIGFIGPSGGGKTTIGLQIAQGQVNRKRHILYISAEQPYEGDIALRVCSLASGAVRKDFEHGVENIPSSTREALERSKNIWNTYFHFVDLSSLEYKIADVQSLFEPYHELARQGVYIDMVIIDWWGEIRDRLMEYNASRNESEARRKNRFWLSELKILIARLNTRLVVLHQLSGAAAGKSSKHVPKSYEAQEDKNFNNRMNFCFAMGTLDSDNRMHIYLDKARSTAKWKCECFLNGPRCLFEAVDVHDNDSAATMLDTGQGEALASAGASFSKEGGYDD